MIEKYSVVQYYREKDWGTSGTQGGWIAIDDLVLVILDEEISASGGTDHTTGVLAQGRLRVGLGKRMVGERNKMERLRG